MGLYIRTTGEPERVTPRNGSRFTYEEMREYIGGQYEPHQLYGRHVMYTRKNGHLLGEAFNAFATACAFWLHAGDYVPGNALICSENEKIFNYGN